MNLLKSQKGQAIILIAFAIVGLVGFGALAIDGGRVLSDRRHAQNAADNSAFAAALAKIKGQDYIAAAQNRAISNGYTDGVNSTLVQVNLCNEAGITCAGMPAGANGADYIRVRIKSVVPTTFARVIGRNQVENWVEAIAHAQGVTSSPAFSGAALVAMRTCGEGINSNGNVTLDVNGSGVFSNSSCTCSIDFSGNGTYTADGNFTIATGGTECKTGNISQTPGTPVSGGQLPYPPTNLDVPAPTITCPAGENKSGNTYNPGTYDAETANLNGTVTFNPGNYCFNGSFRINGNANVVANGVNFRINSGEFSINGNSTFTCSNVIVYSAGGSGMQFNGNGANSCSGITFYLATGSVTWNGNVANQFTAPTSGPYKGLLIYLPLTNNSGLTINGNSGNQLTGSIIAPASTITINGNSGTSGLHTQIIGYDITLNGNSNTVINFDPNEQYIPDTEPFVELTK